MADAVDRPKDDGAIGRFNARYEPELTTGCWLWIGHGDKDGYGCMRIKRRNVRAHRFSWTLANGPIPDGLCVLHRCDTPACVNPDHLWLGTMTDNAADRDAKGRARGAPKGHTISTGSKHWKAKLAEADIPIIRLRLASGEIRRTIAVDYGVCVSAISDIKRGVRWAHV